MAATSTLAAIQEAAKDLKSADPAKRKRAEEIKRQYELGLFNDKLVAEGAKPVPVKAPPPQPATTTPTSTPSTTPQNNDKKSFFDFGGFNIGGIKERGMDVWETVKGVGSQVAESAKDAYEIATDKDLTLPQKGFGVLGEGAQAAVGAVGEITTGIGKLVLSQEAEDELRTLSEKVQQGISETEVVKDFAGWYEKQDKDTKLIIEQGGGMLAMMAEVLGAKGANKLFQGTLKKADDTVVPAVRTGAGATYDAGKGAVQTTVGLTQRALTPSPEVVTQRLNQAVERIVQPTGKTPVERADEIAAARRTLTNIESSDVADYATLNNALGKRKEVLVGTQNKYLGQFTERYKPDQLGTYTKVGDETVTTTPVKDALDGLESAYELSGDAVNAAKIKQLRARMESEGLTVAEINQIARDYNIEFRKMAFDKVGNPKQGFKAENYENVRKGVKQVARDRLPDDTSKELDAQLHDLYETERLTNRMQTEVERALAKAPQESKLRKMVGTAVGGAVEIADILSGRIVSNMGRAIASRAGVAQKTSLTPFELQAELSKNLKAIERLNKIKDPEAFAKAFEEYLSTGQLPEGADLPDPKGKTE